MIELVKLSVPILLTNIQMIKKKLKSDLVVVAFLPLLRDEVDVELPGNQGPSILVLYLELQHRHLD